MTAATSATTLVLLLLGLSSVAVVGVFMNEDRYQLIHDAMTWLTLRKNGELLSHSQLLPFMAPILKHYAISKYYRTFVIAFRRGVLPRLTLYENEACNPEYTFKYKNPWNHSVTWFYLKNFTMESYMRRNEENATQYCDYRQGLICNITTSHCQCPYGSSMGPVTEDSEITHCLLNENEICSLIDIEHGYDPHKIDYDKFGGLKKQLHQLIFNLEKPPGCKFGTQCRFKKENGTVSFPRCYTVTDGPWYPESTPPPDAQDQNGTMYRQLGEECTIDLQADPGSCRSNEHWHYPQVPGLTCYNFGPPRSIPESEISIYLNTTGFCAHDYGSFGISRRYDAGNPVRLDYFIMSYVNPRTVPLRGEKLYQFYLNYYKNIAPFFFGQEKIEDNVQSNEVGGPCNMEKTTKMEGIWKFFASLEEGSPGKDYVATEEELTAKMDELLEMMSGDEHWKTKVCKVYWSHYRNASDGSLQAFPPLTCVSGGTPDSHKNDGICAISTNNDTFALSLKFQNFLDHVSEANMAEKYEERSINSEMLRNSPEPACIPHLLTLPHLHAFDDILEGNHCPDGSVCHEDFDDVDGIYDSECQLLPDVTRFDVCHDITAVGKDLGNCERLQLRIEVNATLHEVRKYAKLKKGALCHYNFETTIKEALAEGHTAELSGLSSYQILNWVKRGFLCDISANLRCSQNDSCVQSISDNDYHNGNGKIFLLKWNILMGVVVGMMFLLV